MSEPNALDLVALCRSCGVDDPEPLVSLCEQLRTILHRENASRNLSRILDPDEFWVKHVADCLLVAKWIPDLATTSLAVADLGTGAGFPALLLAAAFPNLTITAIDSSGKKRDFVKLAANELNIKLDVVQGRGRELNRSPEWRGKFDVVTARAVADAATIFRESRSLLRADGRFILYKTPRQAEIEIDPVAKISAKHGFSWRATPVFNLPDDAGERLFLVGERFVLRRTPKTI